MAIVRRRNEARELRTTRGETRTPKFRLPKREEAVLSRRIKYLNDPTRYLVVSTLVPKFVLYYDVKEDVFAWNDPTGGTVFKRRAMAAAVARLLGPRLEIVQCKVNKNGSLVKRSVRIPHRTSYGPQALEASPGRRRGHRGGDGCGEPRRSAFP